MANYWVEDYDSGSVSEEEYEQRKIVTQRVIEILKRKSFVRIGYVILDEMKIEASKYDLIDVAAQLEQTGKYQTRYIKHKNGRDDFLVMKIPRKSWKERYWWFIAIITLLIGFFMDVFKDGIKQRNKQPQLKEELAKPQSPSDTSQKE